MVHDTDRTGIRHSSGFKMVMVMVDFIETWSVCGSLQFISMPIALSSTRNILRLSIES